MSIASVHFEVPNLRTLLRHAAPRVIEGTVVPLVLFLSMLRVLGAGGAMIAGVAWAYGAIAVRLVLRRPVPGLLLLGAVTLTARTALAILSGSVFVYFLQPTLGTALVAGAFLLSATIDRPLAGRLANDFCPLPSDVRADHRVRRFFRQISLLWAVTQFANAGLTLWLLLTQSLGTFVVARTALSSLLTVTAIALSTLWFRRSMAQNGIVVTLPAFRLRRARA